MDEMKEEEMEEILVCCNNCSATGLSVGEEVSVETALICPYCGGTGRRKLKFRRFKGRRKIQGVKKVQFDAGCFIKGAHGPIGTPVSYEEWLGGKMPEIPSGEK